MFTKYANIYVDKGVDVLNVTIIPWKWPTKGSQVVAYDILKFLDLNKSYAPLGILGFSVGCYIWGEVLVKKAQDETRYKNIIEKTVGQVWDNAADVTEIPVGLPTAVFANNPVLEKNLLCHIKTFDKVATCHYLRAIQMFHTNVIKAPTLIFVSKVDHVGAVTSYQRARESWENMGMKVYWNCFEDSARVGHLHRYPKEYLSALNALIDNIQMAVKPELLVQAKI